MKPPERIIRSTPENRNFLLRKTLLPLIAFSLITSSRCAFAAIYDVPLGTGNVPVNDFNTHQLGTNGTLDQQLLPPNEAFGFSMLGIGGRDEWNIDFKNMTGEPICDFHFTFIFLADPGGNLFNAYLDFSDISSVGFSPNTEHSINTDKNAADMWVQGGDPCLPPLGTFSANIEVDNTHNLVKFTYKLGIRATRDVPDSAGLSCSLISLVFLIGIHWCTRASASWAKDG